ncbi:Cupredoxin [Xylariales sp. PMI_506]|nr:Cupredoxin [Xylariales sp. PMI_506]
MSNQVTPETVDSVSIVSSSSSTDAATSTTTDNSGSDITVSASSSSTDAATSATTDASGSDITVSASTTSSSSSETSDSSTATSSSSSSSSSDTTVSTSSSSDISISTSTASSSSLSSTSVSTSASATASSNGNTATTRSQWGDYSIYTDYNTIAPDTGVTREYWFELSEVTIAPNGVERYAMAINGSIPGPTIYADWGDTVVVHVTNALTTSHNGTSIHFHGIRQNYTNQNDGVASITQCPTPPGSVETYTWKAVQYGSTWYHSHFALQAWEGVFGGIIINGPASANYDEDLGVMMLNDWDHSTVDELWALTPGGLPTLETGLINGTNVWGTGGHRWNTSVTAGTSYRLRLVNGAINSHFKFMIDDHTLTVIASDLVPVVPYTTDYIDIGMGQRYDVIITANQASTADSFWLRAIPQSTCSDTDNANDIKGIIYYGSSTATPTTTAYTFTDSCDDETSSLVPVVAANVGDETWETVEIAALGGPTPGGAFVQRWTLNSTSMTVDWKDPSLLQIHNSEAFVTSNAIIELDGVDEWAYLVIETDMTIPHPIHLHGHDFFILSQGTGTFSQDSINLTNPPRRDTAMLPGQGYLALAFKTDNPGAWLMHCHIGWHTTEGFALQFIERKSEIMALTDTTSLVSQCANWAAYQTAQAISQGSDSGI